MRRSVREAIVGFSIAGAVVGLAGTMLWLRGVSLGSNTWTVTAEFSEAGGLAERSPVTYRGIVVGVVQSVAVTPASVRVVLEINQDDLRLPMPVTASVGSGSLLGGTAQVNLVSSGDASLVVASTPGPKAGDCPPSTVLCEGATIQGRQGASLDSVTASLQRLLDEAEKQQLVESLVDSARQFDAVVAQLGDELERAGPMITNLNRATEEAARAATHISNISAAFDNPQTISDLKQTLVHARGLTERFEAVGGDVESLTSDPRFMQGVRDVAIGLGAFFQELYPAQTAKP